MSKESKSNESSLDDHKQHKKELKPPFLSHGFDMTTSAWFDERLPEMLWAVLVVGNMERDKALEFFRYIGKFVESNNECSTVTITGISKFSDTKRKEFIKYMTEFSKETTDILSNLLLFPELPNFDEWKTHLPEPESKGGWYKVGKSVDKTFWHQSEEANDCRWIKVLCEILGGKVKFSKDIEGIEEMVRGISEYPNYGDMKRVRPSIRSMEMGLTFPKDDESIWAKYFWKYCFENTNCAPEEVINKKIQKRQKKLSEEREKV